jgi:hypothetical protein
MPMGVFRPEFERRQVYGGTGLIGPGLNNFAQDAAV